MRGCRRHGYLKQAVAQGSKLVRFVFKRRYKTPPNFPPYGCLAYLAGRAGVDLDSLLSQVLWWTDNMCGYCWRAASPICSSYSLHLPVAEITSLLPSSALPCPLPCTWTREPWPLLLVWQQLWRCIWMSRIFSFWRAHSGDVGGLWVADDLKYLPQHLIQHLTSPSYSSYPQVLGNLHCFH